MNPNWSIPLVLLLGISNAWAQAPKSKRATSTSQAESKKVAGPSIDETQSFIKEKCQLWSTAPTSWKIFGENFIQLFINMNLPIETHKISSEGVTVTFDQSVMKIHQKFFTQRTWSRPKGGRFCDSIIYHIVINIDFKNLAEDGIKFLKTDNAFAIQKNNGISISGSRRFVERDFLDDGEDTVHFSLKEKERFKFLEEIMNGEFVRDEWFLTFTQTAEPERLLTAIRHLSKLHGNKLKPSPF